MSGNWPGRERGGRGRGRGGGQESGRSRGDSALPFNPRGSGQRGWRGPSGDGQYERGRGGGGTGGRSDRGGRGRGRGGFQEPEVYRPAQGGVPNPDSSVTRVENESAHNMLTHMRSRQASQKLESRLPQRPGYGTRGREVILWTNYFRMVVDDDLLLHRYGIEVVEEGGARRPAGKKLKRVIQLLLEEHLNQYGNQIVTDFKSNLLSKTDLKLEAEYTVRYRVEDEDDAAPNAKSYRVKLKHTGTLSVSELNEYLASPQVSKLFGTKEEIIQALNILLGHQPKNSSQIASIGANKHFRLDAASTEKLDLGAGLTAIRGFFVSVRAATTRILVNVQVKNGAFYEDGPLDELMNAFMQANGPDRTKLWNFAKKLTIDVVHIIKKNNAGKIIPRLKQVNGFATPTDGRELEHPPIVRTFGAGSKDVQFFLSEQSDHPSKPPDTSEIPGKKGKGKGKGKKGSGPALAGPSSQSQGRYISVYDYFQLKYPRIKIKNPSLPVINVCDRQNPSYLPPDVCEVQPGQPSRSKLSPSQTQNMIRFAVRRPHQNAQSIVTAGVQALGFDPSNQTLAAFGGSVIPTLITVPGRVLPAPDVKYQGNKTSKPTFGSWYSNRFLTAASMANWTYLRISVKGDERNDPWTNEESLNATIDGFRQALVNSGMMVAACLPGMSIAVDPGRPEADIDNAINLFNTSKKRPPPKMILVILPRDDSAIYNRVKYACDIKEGILNVCVIASKFAKGDSRYYENVALKFNLKLGGRNQSLDSAKLGIIANGKTMVVGIDVTHPAPGASTTAPSVAGMVASVDQFLGQWPGELRIQAGRQEMVADLTGLFKSRLSLWNAKHGGYPENVLVYRDGVSEGQYNMVVDEELPALRKACEQLYPLSSTKNRLPRMTLIIVGKRHNTRFYATRKEDADRSSNPSNGTVVDRGVTESKNWDFFLQAHAAIQGTARPAHYYIVYDEIFRGQSVSAPFTNAADVLEDLTHNICYMFGRANKAVSICPPAYYADLACERARCYLHGLMDQTSSAASVVSGQTSGPGQAVDPGLVKLHDNVRNSMFYI